MVSLVSGGLARTRAHRSLVSRVAPLPVGRVTPRPAAHRIQAAGRRAWAGLSRAGRRVRPLLLFAAAMGCFVTAAFLASMVLGFVVAGVALLVAEWRVTGG